MHTLVKTLFALILPVAFIGTSCNKETKTPECTVHVRSVTEPNFGDVDFDIPMVEFVKLGFNYMDLIDVTFNHVSFDPQGQIVFHSQNSLHFHNLAFVSNYNEVGYFAPCLCNYQRKANYVEFAPGLHAIKNFAWELLLNANEFDVTLRQTVKGGYQEIDDIIDCPIKINFEQADYNHDKYANVRDVTQTGNIRKKMLDGLLIRGSTPFDPKHNDSNDGRNISADFLLGRYHVTHEISLATPSTLTTPEGEKSYIPLTRFMKNLDPLTAPNTIKLFGNIPETDDTIAGTNVYDRMPGTPAKFTDTFFSISMGSDYFTTYDDFTPAVREGGGDISRSVLKYIADIIVNSEGSNPVFYLHCNEGKDRTGWFSMVLEALCGVSFGDIVHDFMLTFTNYYHKFNRYDEKSRIAYDTMKNQTIYRLVYALTCEDPLHQVSTVDWNELDVKQALYLRGLAEDDENTGEKMKEYAVNYVKRLCHNNEQAAKEIYEPIQTYFSGN